MPSDTYHTYFGTRATTGSFGDGCGWQSGWSRTPIALLNRGNAIQGWVSAALVSDAQGSSHGARYFERTAGLVMPVRGKVRRIGDAKTDFERAHNDVLTEDTPQVEVNTGSTRQLHPSELEQAMHARTTGIKECVDASRTGLRSEVSDTRWALTMVATTEPTRFFVGDIWAKDDRVINSMFEGKANRHMATRSQTELRLSRQTTGSLWTAGISTIMAPSHTGYYGAVCGLHTPVAVISTPTLSVVRSLHDGRLVVGAELTSLMTTDTTRNPLDVKRHSATIGARYHINDETHITIRTHHTLEEWQAVLRTPHLSAYVTSPLGAETIPLVGIHSNHIDGTTLTRPMSQFHVQIAPSRKEVGLFLEHKTRTNPVTDDAAIAKTLPRINFIGAFKARLNGHEPTFNISFIISGVIP